MKPLPRNGVYIPPPVHDRQIGAWVKDIAAGIAGILLVALLAFFVVVMKS